MGETSSFPNKPNKGAEREDVNDDGEVGCFSVSASSLITTLPPQHSIIESNSLAFLSKDSYSFLIEGNNSLETISTAAILIAVGNVSFVD